MFISDSYKYACASPRLTSTPPSGWFGEPSSGLGVQTTEIVQSGGQIQKLNTKFLLTPMPVFGSTFAVQIKCHSKPFIYPGVASSVPVRSHTFVEIDHEMISTVIPSMPIHVLQYVIHAQKGPCTHLSFGTYVQKRRVILCTHNQWSLCMNLMKFSRKQVQFFFRIIGSVLPLTGILHW